MLLSEKSLAARLGVNIQTQRKAKGITQDVLAATSGIDRSYIGRIERGEVSITIAKLYLIA